MFWVPFQLYTPAILKVCLMTSPQTWRSTEDPNYCHPRTEGKLLRFYLFHHGLPIFFVVNLAFWQAQQAKEAAEVGCGQGGSRWIILQPLFTALLDGWKHQKDTSKPGLFLELFCFFWVIEVIILARSQPKTSPKTLGNGYKGSNSPMAKGSDTPIRFRLPSEELQLDQRWVGQKTLVGFFPWSWSTFFTMSSKGMGAAWLWLVDGSTLFSRRGSCKTSLKTTILRWNGIIFC